jgi:hypothetical protein
MSNEKSEADDSRGLKEVLAVFSEVARNTSEAEGPPVTVAVETVRAVFREVARNASESEVPAVTNDAESAQPPQP